MKVAFVGRKGLGGVSMRAESAAAALRVRFIDVKRFDAKSRFDTIVVCKYWNDRAREIRRACRRLVFDPLDCWTRLEPGARPREFWRWCHDQLVFDEILATTPSAVDSMGEERCRLVRHHADPRIDGSFYDPLGPVVYCGGPSYVEPLRAEIEHACRILGRRFVCDTRRGRLAWRSLRGAALMLHPRFAPTDTPLNRECKPQVKLENAAAATLPVLCSRHACVTGIRSSVVFFEDHRSMAEAISVALASPRLHGPFTFRHYVARLRELLALSEGRGP